MTNAARSNRFTIKEGLTLGEKVFWPASLLNMFFSLLHRILDAAGWQVMAIFALNFAIAVLAALPWAIRRATRSEFKRFRLVVRRPGLQESDDLSYGESLRLSTPGRVRDGWHCHPSIPVVDSFPQYALVDRTIGLAGNLFRGYCGDGRASAPQRVQRVLLARHSRIA